LKNLTEKLGILLISKSLELEPYFWPNLISCCQ